MHQTKTHNFQTAKHYTLSQVDPKIWADVKKIEVEKFLGKIRNVLITEGSEDISGLSQIINRLRTEAPLRSPVFVTTVMIQILPYFQN